MQSVSALETNTDWIHAVSHDVLADFNFFSGYLFFSGDWMLSISALETNTDWMHAVSYNVLADFQITAGKGVGTRI